MTSQPDKITISNEQLNLFVIAGKQYTSSSGETVLRIAIEELLPIATKKLQKLERAIEMQRVKFAKKTGSKHIDRDRYGNYQFTEKDIEDLNKVVDDLNAETVELPYNIVDAKDVPDDLSYDFRKAFEGVVIPKITRKFDNLPQEEEVEDKHDD